MLNKKERENLESSLINSLLENTNGLMQAMSMKLTGDLFLFPVNIELFSVITDYFNRFNRAGSASELFEFVLLNVQQYNSDAKDLIKKGLTQAQIKDFSPIDKLVLRLLDDNIEREVNKCIEKLRSENLTGLDYSMNLIKYMSEVVSKYTSNIVNEADNNILITKYLKRIEEIREGTASEFIPTKISTLDRNILGIRKGHLSIIAARPGMGKTSFALYLMQKFLSCGMKVVCFSIEMDRDNLYTRILSNLSNIDSLKIEGGLLTSDELELVIKKSEILKKQNYIIDDSPAQTIDSIIAKLNSWKVREAVDIVIIDYLTLIASNTRKDRYDLEIANLSKELRIFAKSTGIPILVLSQLNRFSEHRKEKRPGLADLRESGSIEQDANLVLLLHRPHYYGINPFKERSSKIKTLDGDDLKPEEYLELIIAKARNGKTGTVPLRYLTKVHQFEEVKFK